MEADIEFYFSVVFEKFSQPLFASQDDALCFLSVVWEEHVEDVRIFSFLIIVLSSGLKTFFDHFSSDLLEEFVV